MIALGLDGWHYLGTRDRAERLVLERLFERVQFYAEQLQEQQAVLVVNTYGKALKRNR